MLKHNTTNNNRYQQSWVLTSDSIK